MDHPQSTSDIVKKVGSTNVDHDAERVRAVLMAGDRRRRVQHAAGRAWRAAPLVAGVALAVAALGRFAGWPARTPLVLVAAGLLAWIGWVLAAGRRRPVSDAAAWRLDTDAALGGELRSAGWFAAQPARDEWADLHVGRAAERLAEIDWVHVYPPVRAPRARAATAALVFATLALSVVLPPRPSRNATAARGQTSVASPAAPRGDPASALPPELQKELEALLAAAESGAMAAGHSPATAVSAAQMRDLIDRLQQIRDRGTLKDLAEAMNSDRTVKGADALKQLGERAKRAAAETDASREARTALEELARKLSEAADAEEAAAAAASESLEDPAAAPGDAGASAKDGGAVRTLSEAPASADGAGTVVMSRDDAQPGTAAPGFGIGGASGAAGPEGTAAGMSEALRQELIEANKDTAGTNVHTEIRRKTEQGEATVSFTHGTATRGDRARSAAPDRVPEGRQSDIRRYFTRNPPPAPPR